MALVEINGVEIPTFRDTVAEDAFYLGDTSSRGATGRLFDNRIARKRRWSFEMPHRRWESAERYKEWIEGRGHAWRFGDAGKYASTGVGNSTSGSFTLGSSGGKHGGRITVASGSSFGVELRNKMGVAQLGLATAGAIGAGGWDPTQGWTMSFWAFLTVAEDGVGADGWYHVLAHGDVVVTGSAANPAGVTQYLNGLAGAHAFGNIASVRVGTTPFTSVRGRTTAGVSAARQYDDLVVLPYQVDPEWVPSIYAFAEAYEAPMLPFVFLGGDVVNGGAPVRVRGRCDSMKYRTARVSGAPAVEANNRVVSVLLEEW